MLNKLSPRFYVLGYATCAVLIAIVLLAAAFGYLSNVSAAEFSIRIILLLGLPPLFGWFAWFVMRVRIVPHLAETGEYFVYPIAGSMQYLYNGKDLCGYVLPKGWSIDADGKLVVESKANPIPWSTWFWGAQWIGFPPMNIASWEQERPRKFKVGDEPVKGEVEVDVGKKITRKIETVSELFIVQQLADDFLLRLKDGSQAKLTMSFFGNLVNPKRPVIELHGKWYPAIRAVLENELEIFGKNYDNADLASGKTLSALKAHLEEDSKFKDAIRDASGYMLYKFLIEGGDPTNKAIFDQNQRKAEEEAKFKADEVAAKNQANVTVIKSVSEATRIVNRGKARAAAIKAERESAGEQYLDVLQTKAVMALGRGGLGVFAPGNTKLLINATADKKTPKEAPAAATPSTSPTAAGPEPRREPRKSGRPGPRQDR